MILFRKYHKFKIKYRSHLLINISNEISESTVKSMMKYKLTLLLNQGFLLSSFEVLRTAQLLNKYIRNAIKIIDTHIQ